MGDIIFDSNKKGSDKYESNGKLIYSSSYYNFRHYVLCKNIYAMPQPEGIIKFKTKCQSGETITVDSSGLYNFSYKICCIDLFFREDNKNLGPIIFGIIMEKQCVDSPKTEHLRKYYKFRELIVNGVGSPVKLSDFKSIPDKDLKEKHLDDEYRNLVTTVDINLHEKHIYKGGFSIDQYGKSCKSYVTVGDAEKVKGLKEFVKYSHTPNVNFFVELKIFCPNNCCNLMGFEGSKFQKTNTEKVFVYFCSYDDQHKIPLLVEIVDKNCQNGTYFQLINIYEDRSEYNQKKWIKNYIKIKNDLKDIEKCLNEIHNDNKDKIDKILNRVGPYKKTMDGLMAGFGLCTILLAGASTGIWIYLNLERARGVFNHLYRRFH